MTRTRFFDGSANRAGLVFEDFMSGELREYHFWAPEAGGYLRLNDGAGGQLCGRFSKTGATLLWDGQGRLVDFVRREYRRMRAAERRERERY